ncbi:MAG: alpha/beta hydrolase [Burkholderiaceae bacterium]|jgi:haloacetate dehalogenase
MFEQFTLAQRQVNGVRINFRQGGKGPPLLLLHGYPQTHVIWHKLADQLAQHFTLVMPDLRGYGDSEKPRGSAGHENYSKRVMAQDMVSLMQALGYDNFALCGHDRGGRVAHRLVLDHPACVNKLMIVDISPTRTMFEATDQRFAQVYYHWFFLSQPYPLPETLIGNNAEFFINYSLGSLGSNGSTDFFTPEALAQYRRCFCDPAMIHAGCEDYRAATTIDLLHDQDHEHNKIACPLHVVWGENGVVGKLFSPISDWQEKSLSTVTGKALPAGHFIPDQAPELLLEEMMGFFSAAQ